VEEGQLMFVLDQRPFLAEVESAQGEVARQKALLWNAEQTKNRMVPLYLQNAVSQKDLDNAIAELLASEANVEKAQADLYRKELDLGFASIVAPVKGLASQSNYRPGALILPGASEESLLTTLYVVDPIWVNFNISDNDLLQLRKGMKEGRISLPPNRQFRVEAILSDGTTLPGEGTIDFMNPAIQQNTGTMLVRAVFPNPHLAIYPGLFVKVRVMGASYPNAMVVPQAAVVQGATGPFVYVIKNGKAEVRPVTPGSWYKDYWIIDQGLQAGDIVIAKGVNRVQQGTPVTIQSMMSSRPPL
ncbi:MAG: efflux RND transporter periplasmic adaptor subunit, partial [Chlamydiia bacterium]|nr:efflux RND transporter periplasmic adaptor subunit [Chlamydiia bacterium]